MWLGFEVEETLRVHIKFVMNQHEKKRKSQSMTTVRKGGGLGLIDAF